MEALAIILLTYILLCALQRQGLLGPCLCEESVFFLGKYLFSLPLALGVLALSRWTIGICWWSIRFKCCYCWVFLLLLIDVLNLHAEALLTLSRGWVLCLWLC